MTCNRRDFVKLTCASAAGSALGGCSGASSPTGENLPIRFHPIEFDAGPESAYAADGVYDRFAGSGFFIVRRGAALLVLSSLCTHRKCRLHAESDHTFYCKCHGSTFDPSGHVTEGPATRDLPLLPTASDPRGHLIVRAVAETV